LCRSTAASRAICSEPALSKLRLRLPSPGTLIGTGLLLVALTAAALWVVPSDEYLFLPDKARPVAPLVTVKGGKDPTGSAGIYYDAVIIRRAKLFEQIFPWIHDGSTLVPDKQVNPPGVSDSQRRAEDLQEMARSQNIAAAVALKYLGYDVKVGYTGALVGEVVADSPAAKAGIQPTEVIVSVDGKPVRKTDDLRRLITAHPPGTTIRLGVRGAKGI